jgi:hypothetical protein
MKGIRRAIRFQRQSHDFFLFTLVIVQSKSASSSNFYPAVNLKVKRFNYLIYYSAVNEASREYCPGRWSRPDNSLRVPLTTEGSWISQPTHAGCSTEFDFYFYCFAYRYDLLSCPYNFLSPNFVPTRVDSHMKSSSLRRVVLISMYTRLDQYVFGSGDG